MVEKEPKIVVVGAGGVAESLVAALSLRTVSPMALMSPTLGHAEQLVERYALKSQVVHTLMELPTDADIYLFAVPDHAVQEVSQAMPATEGVWMHTAASVPLEELSSIHRSSAVFYPLNTFTKGRPLPLEQTPLFYEVADQKAYDAVISLAHLLQMNGREASLGVRRQLHVAAVFACNFVNHQWAVATKILQRAALPVEVLHPLMQETLQKAIQLGALEGQTGPARRGDTVTMQTHEQLLADHPELWQEMYRLLSRSIACMAK